MAHSLSFLISAEAAAERMVERKPNFVVHIELDHGSDVADRFVELDCITLNGAMRLIDDWMRDGKYASGSMRRVMDDGELHEPCWTKYKRGK